ncbi:MAG: bifunctional folylpolyglutamate synthase/dihydrofolate synthase [Thermoplasmata archaeon]|nr:bifunctional folylpolyglutamate synthase/dihydrofolate synthase [Thermoplasmata archaeon]
MKELENLLEELYELKRVGIKLGLERISKLLSKLGNPHRKYRIIHVAGTNGKGSVCRMISSILVEGGYSVGLYTSPHLIRLNERFVIDGREVEDGELLTTLKTVIDIAEEIDEKPTFFEISTATAFELFKEKNVDFAVVEAGMGGRYDATNVVSPAISIITSISKDHSEFLGGGIEDIAKEKAGIIKEKISVVTSATGKALDVISEVSKSKKSELITAKGRWERKDFGLNWQSFSVNGILRDYEIKTPLLGRFQGENITLSVLAAEKLQMLGIFLPEGSIERGIANATNPGRMEIVSANPNILLDGAHNVDAIKALVESLNDFSYNNLILILGILKDKDIKGMVKEIASLAGYVITTMPRNERVCNPEKIGEFVAKYNAGCKVYTTRSVKEALSVAKRIARSDDLICVTGSLYTVGEARAIIIP